MVIKKCAVLFSGSLFYKERPEKELTFQKLKISGTFKSRDYEGFDKS